MGEWWWHWFTQTKVGSYDYWGRIKWLKSQCWSFKFWWL